MSVTRMDSTEGRLVEQAQAGDRRSFERLVARWDGEVLNLAYRLTGHLEDARDVRVDYERTNPQLRIEIDRPRAEAEFGITPNQASFDRPVGPSGPKPPGGLPPGPPDHSNTNNPPEYIIDPNGPDRRPNTGDEDYSDWNSP